MLHHKKNLTRVEFANFKKEHDRKDLDFQDLIQGDFVLSRDNTFSEIYSYLVLETAFSVRGGATCKVLSRDGHVVPSRCFYKSHRQYFVIIRR